MYESCDEGYGSLSRSSTGTDESVPTVISGDFETKSYADLKKVGAWVYSQHPTTEIICFCYAIDDGDVQEWWPGMDMRENRVRASIAKDMPYDLYIAIKEGQLFEAWNVSFERSHWVNIMVPEFGWILPKDDQWRDTMVTACYYALPAALDRCSKVLGFGGKDPEGSRLITKYSKLHLKTAKTEIPPEDFRKFVDYCKDDVMQEQDIADFLGPLPQREVDAFLVDQKMNMRGLYLNEDSLRDALAIVTERAAELKEEFFGLTGLSPSQGDKCKAWFHEQGAPMENLQAKYIEEVLEGKHEFKPKGEVKRALTLRSKFNKASTKKITAMLRNRSDDGRARFQTRSHGTMTGRPTGTGFQPLNLSKGFEGVPPEQLLRDMKHRSPKWLDAMYGDAMEAVGKASRHHIKAEEGNIITAGDFVSVEAVIMSCLAGEQWKIDAFRNKEPVYELMACSIHNLGDNAIAFAKADKDGFKDEFSAERFDGKTGELAFQYQGALGAWRKFDNSDRYTDERVVEICKSWREENPNIVKFWYAMDDASKKCVQTGQPTEAGLISFEKQNGWLSMRMPSGKKIWYFKPEMRLGMPHWHQPWMYDPEDESTWEKYEDCHAKTCKCEPVLKLSYMSMKNGQWVRVSTYGGKTAENATQCVASEVMKPALQNLDRMGCGLILSVYDEAVSEDKIGFVTPERYADAMLDREKWSRDWPINVDVWQAPEYKK